MNIQEAIEKAGLDGKGRNYRTKNEFEITTHGDIFFMKPLTVLEMSDCNWEVVEEQTIEVGDTVQCHICETGEDAIVLAINGTVYAVQYLSGSLHVYCKSDLKLIHKGPRKHVFEGVAIRPLVEHDAIPVQANNQVLYPHGWLDLKGNGKTYRMELVEE